MTVTLQGNFKEFMFVGKELVNWRLPGMRQTIFYDIKGILWVDGSYLSREVTLIDLNIRLF